MFTSSCNTFLLKHCMSAKISTYHPTFLNKIIDLVDNNNAFIFGSVMLAYMLDSPLMNSNPARDVDILFIDDKSKKSFENDIIQYVSNNSNFPNENVKWHKNDKLPNYSFSDKICDRDQIQFNITMKPNNSSFYYKLDLHLVSLIDHHLGETDYIKYLFENVFVYEYTKTIYYRKEVYSQLDSIKTIYRTNLQLSQFDKKCQQKGISFCKESASSNRSKRLSKQTLSVNYSAYSKELTLGKIKYQKLGFVVIPLNTTIANKAGKAPAVKGWAKKTNQYDFDATKYCNIGIVCGEESGIVCIDVDQKDDGMFYFDKMIQHYGLPDCPTQITPNGGRHYIFKYNEVRMETMKFKIKGAKLGNRKIGIDLWIKNCQFVVSPSFNRENGKAYTWSKPIISRDAIPELPEWIYDLYTYVNISEDGQIVRNVIDKDLYIQNVQPQNESISNQVHSVTMVPSQNAPLPIVAVNTEHEIQKMNIKEVSIFRVVVVMLLFVIFAILGAVLSGVGFIIIILSPANFRMRYICIQVLDKTKAMIS